MSKEFLPRSWSILQVVLSRAKTPMVRNVIVSLVRGSKEVSHDDRKVLSSWGSYKDH